MGMEKAGDGKGVVTEKPLPEAAAAKGGPGGPGGGRGPAPVTDEDLGGGAWLKVTGGYGAVVVNFKDSVVVVEGPSNEARGEAIIAEAKKLVPGKPASST